jgi:signal transduction histidine kinase
VVERSEVTWLERWRALPLPARDAVLSLPVAMIVLMATATSTNPVWPDEPWLPWVLAALTVAVLMWRRRAPLVTWWVAVGLAVALPVAVRSSEAALIVLAFAAYSVLANPPYANPIRVGVVSFVAALAGSVASDAIFDSLSLDTVVMPALTVLYGVGVGAVMRANRATAAALASRNAELERLHGVEAREAVLAERGRIARELHDIVAHHVSGIVLQAKAARSSISSGHGDLVTAEQALGEIAESGSAALVSMRSLLGMLRDDGSVEIAPQPGLADLPALVASGSGRGLTATLLHEGDPREVPVDVQLSAYRIVQEALTNSLKHAGPASVDVHVRHHPRELELTVVDDGAPSTPNGASGNGLIGMRERVALFGGTLDAGPCAEGGFRVHARLPVGAPLP